MSVSGICVILLFPLPPVLSAKLVFIAFGERRWRIRKFGLRAIIEGCERDLGLLKRLAKTD
jgi:hypothetical protein